MPSSRRPTHLHLVSRAYLREALRRAVDDEDYEYAAEIRDEMAYRDRFGEPQAVTTFCHHTEDCD